MQVGYVMYTQVISLAGIWVGCFEVWGNEL